jgi:hypothetical protein
MFAIVSLVGIEVTLRVLFPIPQIGNHVSRRYPITVRSLSLDLTWHQLRFQEILCHPRTDMAYFSEHLLVDAIRIPNKHCLNFFICKHDNPPRN